MHSIWLWPSIICDCTFRLLCSWHRKKTPKLILIFRHTETEDSKTYPNLSTYRKRRLQNLSYPFDIQKKKTPKLIITFRALALMATIAHSLVRAHEIVRTSYCCTFRDVFVRVMGTIWLAHTNLAYAVLSFGNTCCVLRSLLRQWHHLNYFTHTSLTPHNISGFGCTLRSL
jgi:hypothetical protein